MTATTTRLIISAMMVSLFSCRIGYLDICGTYELKHFPKSTLITNSDSSFVFTQNYPNPYLHPFPHTDEYYFKTIGIWSAVPGIIQLLGTDDVMDYRTVNILSAEPASNHQSTFKFVDEFGDTVPILFVQYSNSSSAARLHHTMEDFAEDLTIRDTLQFHFFGYEPWTFIQGEQTNKNYAVELLPKFKPNAIDSMYLRLRRNVIGSKKLKFMKVKG